MCSVINDLALTNYDRSINNLFYGTANVALSDVSVMSKVSNEI